MQKIIVAMLMILVVAPPTGSAQEPYKKMEIPPLLVCGTLEGRSFGVPTVFGSTSFGKRGWSDTSAGFRSFTLIAVKSGEYDIVFTAVDNEKRSIAPMDGLKVAVHTTTSLILKAEFLTIVQLYHFIRDERGKYSLMFLSTGESVGRFSNLIVSTDCQ